LNYEYCKMIDEFVFKKPNEEDREVVEYGKTDYKTYLFPVLLFLICAVIVILLENIHIIIK